MCNASAKNVVSPRSINYTVDEKTRRNRTLTWLIKFVEGLTQLLKVVRVSLTHAVAKSGLVEDQKKSFIKN